MCCFLVDWLVICLFPKPSQYSLSYILNFQLFPMGKITGVTGYQRDQCSHGQLLVTCDTVGSGGLQR